MAEHVTAAGRARKIAGLILRRMDERLQARTAPPAELASMADTLGRRLLPFLQQVQTDLAEADPRRGSYPSPWFAPVPKVEELSMTWRLAGQVLSQLEDRAAKAASSADLAALSAGLVHLSPFLFRHDEHP